MAWLLNRQSQKESTAGGAFFLGLTKAERKKQRSAVPIRFCSCPALYRGGFGFRQGEAAQLNLIIKKQMRFFLPCKMLTKPDRAGVCGGLSFVFMSSQLLPKTKKTTNGQQKNDERTTKNDKRNIGQKVGSGIVLYRLFCVFMG